MIIDAWAQHPTLQHMQNPISDPLRRWTKTEAPTEELPVAATVAMMPAPREPKPLKNACFDYLHILASLSTGGYLYGNRLHVDDIPYILTGWLLHGTDPFRNEREHRYLAFNAREQEK